MNLYLRKLSRSGESIIDEYVSVVNWPSVPRKGELVALHNYMNSSKFDWETITKQSVKKTEYQISPLRVVEVMHSIGSIEVEKIWVYLATDELYNEIIAKSLVLIKTS